MIVFYTNIKNKESHKIWNMVTLEGQNDHILLFSKIFSNILLFMKYLAIYHIFKTWVCKIRIYHVIWIPKMRVLWKTNFQVCCVIFYGIWIPETPVTLKNGNYFFIKFEFMKLKGGVWWVFSNNNFQFLNNISCIFTHFFTYMYLYKNFK